MRKLYIHIGGGKTGSSALQSFLSGHTLLEDGKRSVEYLVLTPDGRASRGAGIKVAAERSPYRYAVSAYDISKIERLEGLDLLPQASAQHDFVISHEGWIYSAETFRKGDVVRRLGLPAEVIVYVRPHVEWINAAWIQWWMWARQYSDPLEAVNKLGTNFVSWLPHIEPWKTVPGVEKVTVRLHSSDIVGDFLKAIGVRLARTESVRHNVSLGATLLKLLMHFPEVRSAHDGDVDIILARHLMLEEPTPWFLTPDVVERFIQRFRDDAEGIQGQLAPDLRKVMTADERWWSTSAYDGKETTKMTDLQLTLQDCLVVLGKLVPALLRMDRTGS
jgi:hypothetical protein